MLQGDNAINNKTMRALVVVYLTYLIIVSFMPVNAQSTTGIFKITLVAPGTANQARRQWAQIIRGTMQQVGIEAHVVYMGWGAVFDRILFAPKDIWGKTFDEGGYDALFIGYGWTIPFPIANLLTQYGNGTGKAAEAYFPPGPNWYYFEDEEYSRMATTYIRTLDSSERLQIIKEMQAYLQSYGPDFIIFYDRTVSAVSPKLKNFNPLMYYAPSWWAGLKTVTVAVPGELTALNYILSNSWYDVPFLFAYNDLSNGAGITMEYGKGFAPSTFTEWTSSADGKSWIIKLRQGVKWHDGEELTADDFLFYLWTQYTPETGSQALGYWTSVLGSKVTLTWLNGTKTVKDTTAEGVAPTIGSAEVVDRYTLEVSLPESYGLFYPESLNGWAPLPKHILEKVPPIQWSTHSFNTGTGTYTITLSDGTKKEWVGPVGIGPYVFDSYDPVRQVVKLKKSKTYWNATGLESLGLYTIETLNVQFITEKEAALAALKAGEVDVLDFNYHFEKDIARFDPSWGVVTVFDAFGLQELGLNMRHPVFGTGVATPLGKQNPARAKEAAWHVRRAIDHLIPRQLIIDSLMDGFPRPGVTFVLPPQMGFNEDLTPTKYDLDEARRHLEAAGYEVPRSPVEVLPPTITSFLLGMPLAISGKFINASSGLPFALPLKLEIQESTDGGETWQRIGDTSTDSFGNFQYTVVPASPGSHLYRVYFPGNAIPLEEWMNIVGAKYGEIYPSELLRLIPPLSSPVASVEVTTIESTLQPMMTRISDLESQIADLRAQIGTLTALLYGAIFLILVLGGAALYFSRKKVGT